MINGCLDLILIQSWIWVFKLFIGTLKYMAMAVFSIFVGPGKTVERLARSNASRKSGVHPDEVSEVLPELYKVEKAKVIAWMVWAYTIWLFEGVVTLIGLTGGLS